MFVFDIKSERILHGSVLWVRMEHGFLQYIIKTVSIPTPLQRLITLNISPLS